MQLSYNHLSTVSEFHDFSRHIAAHPKWVGNLPDYTNEIEETLKRETLDVIKNHMVILW